MCEQVRNVHPCVGVCEMVRECAGFHLSVCGCVLVQGLHCKRPVSGLMVCHMDAQSCESKQWSNLP